jgi:hypothetical protein
MNLILILGHAFINLSAIACSTAPSGFSRITVESTVSSPLNLGQIVLLALAEFIVIVPLARTTAAIPITKNLFFLFIIAYLSVVMHHPVTATLLSEVFKN